MVVSMEVLISCRCTYVIQYLTIRFLPFSGAVVDTPSIARQHCFGNTKAILCTSDDQVWHFYNSSYRQVYL